MKSIKLTEQRLVVAHWSALYSILYNIISSLINSCMSRIGFTSRANKSDYLFYLVWNFFLNNQSYWSKFVYNCRHVAATKINKK